MDRSRTLDVLFRSPVSKPPLRGGSYTRSGRGCPVVGANTGGRGSCRAEDKRGLSLALPSVLFFVGSAGASPSRARLALPWSGVSHSRLFPKPYNLSHSLY